MIDWNECRQRQSLVDDLSSIVTARNASQRRSELFVVDNRCKCCDIVVICDTAGTTEDRHNQTRVEIRQARPKSARKVASQRVIWMLRILRGATDLVHVTNRVPRGSFSWKSCQDFGMFLRDIEPVERVEQDKSIALGNEEGFPGVP